MFKFLKMLIGIALLPACWAVSVAVYTLYQTALDSVASEGLAAWALPVGFVLWVALFFLLPRPFRTYVLGHELTHALWALMMGGRVGRMKVGKSGGHVELTKTNFIITLAPYFFPFYTFLVIGAYYLAGIWLEVEPYKVWWLGAVGFTWAFHVTFTLSMLAEHQPDIHEHGRIFSYTVIFLMNVLVIGLWMVLVGDPKFASFGDLLTRENARTYSYSSRLCVSAWVFVEQLIKRLG
ncbi:MAG: hypothetical protein K9M54_12515 [Kiritimatiellales bacterium]|nr:hypothetical protein [Kiritimatiellales bacterium]